MVARVARARVELVHERARVAELKIAEASADGRARARVARAEAGPVDYFEAGDDAAATISGEYGRGERLTAARVDCRAAVVALQRAGDSERKSLNKIQW